MSDLLDRIKESAIDATVIVGKLLGILTFSAFIMGVGWFVTAFVLMIFGVSSHTSAIVSTIVGFIGAFIAMFFIIDFIEST